MSKWDSNKGEACGHDHVRQLGPGTRLMFQFRDGVRHVRTQRDSPEQLQFHFGITSHYLVL